MKIVNFNRGDKKDLSGLLDTYISWNKQYCYDLNRKITSLYDRMILNYPEYLIFNSPTPLSGYSDFEPYRSLIDNSKEGRLVIPYEQHVTIKENDTEEKRSIFFPSRLNFHQGFYNQSKYGDGFLIFFEGFEGDYSIPIYKINNEQVCLLDDILYTSINTLTFDEADKETESFGLDFTNELVKAYFWKNHEWTEADMPQDMEDPTAWIMWWGGSDTHYWTINWSNIPVDCTRILLIFSNHAAETGKTLERNFPAGYMCIAKKQPVGMVNEVNRIKNDLSSYLIAPIGNGGYYNAWWDNADLKATYQANELGNFSNHLVVNLAQNCRFLNWNTDTFSFNALQDIVAIANFTFTNQYTKEVQLADKYQNIWTGSEDIIGQTYLQGERVFADIEYTTNRSVIYQQDIRSFIASTKTRFSFNKIDLLIY